MKHQNLLIAWSAPRACSWFVNAAIVPAEMRCMMTSSSAYVFWLDNLKFLPKARYAGLDCRFMIQQTNRLFTPIIFCVAQ